MFTFQMLHNFLQQITVRHDVIIHSSPTTKLNVYICLNEQHAADTLGVWGLGSTHS